MSADMRLREYKPFSHYGYRVKMVAVSHSINRRAFCLRSMQQVQNNSFMVWNKKSPAWCLTPDGGKGSAM